MNPATGERRKENVKKCKIKREERGQERKYDETQRIKIIKKNNNSFI